MLILELWMSQAAALEPEKSWFAFPHYKDPKNGRWTSLIIVISHQKCCKWRWIKVCDANFGAVNVPSISLVTWKKSASVPSAQGPNKWKFDSPHHCDKSPKMLQVALFLKSVWCWFLELWMSQASGLEPEKVGFPPLSPRTQQLKVWHSSSLW